MCIMRNTESYSLNNTTYGVHMSNLDTSNDKVQAICDLLRRETLEPAITEAEEIIARAKNEAKIITQNAKNESDTLIAAAQQEISRETDTFKKSLERISETIIADLKDKITLQIVNKGIGSLLAAHINEKATVTSLVSAVVDAISDNGIYSDMTLYISKVFEDDVLILDALHAMNKGERELNIEFLDVNGVKIHLSEQDVTIDITDKSLLESVSALASPRVKALLFNN